MCIDYSDYIGWETTFRSTVIGEINDILVVEDIAYLAYGINPIGGRLCVVDVSDPTDPQLLAIEPSDWNFYSPARDVAINGPYAYVTSDSDLFLTVVDISNPALPEVVNTLSGVGYAYSIDVDDGFAYITRFAGGLRSYLSVYSLANPVAPVLVADVPVPIFSEKAWVIDGYAFLSCRYYLFGMFILDVSNPANPQPFGVIPTSPHDICVTSSYLYIANNEELMIMPTLARLFALNYKPLRELIWRSTTCLAGLFAPL